MKAPCSEQNTPGRQQLCNYLCNHKTCGEAKEQVIQMQPDAKVGIWKNKYRIVRDRLPNESVIFMAVPITGLYGTEDEAWRAAALKLTARNG